MNRCLWIALLLLGGLPLSRAEATPWKKDSQALARVNNRIRGKMIDYTANHGHDNRMWSPALGQKRDLYVYLPPNYDCTQRYPFMILMHGFGVDEQVFLDTIPELDEAICKNKLPPMVIAMPDGSIKGEPSMHQPGSFFINTEAGPFEDFILQDVWDLVTKRYSIRSEREAHILAGTSMGGFGAFNLGIRYRQNFGVVAAIFPPLNLRWTGCNQCYFDDFDPRFWGWRTKIENPHEVIARFGLIRIHLGDFVGPLYGINDDTMARVSRENPIELVDRTHLRDGELAMYIAYAGKDEFNIDAQVESFLYLCKFRGITVYVGYDPNGRHDGATARRLMPGVLEFLNRQVGPYAPFACGPCGDCCVVPCGAGACAGGACMVGECTPAESLPAPFAPGACKGGDCQPGRALPGVGLPRPAPAESAASPEPRRSLPGLAAPGPRGGKK